MDVITPNAAALEVTEFILPYIGMVLIVVFGFMVKDFATKLSKGIAFSMNRQFQEGDHVLLDGERALIVKIGITQTVFGVTKVGGELDGDYIWRYVPNERIDFLKLEKIIFDRTPINNNTTIKNNSNRIEELENGKL
jgi:small-conductance mechanosensitive channel|tara:strand:- start:198 stop:608 length:411 start_codon:yes stop_codon:yes gene_type:complete